MKNLFNKFFKESMVGAVGITTAIMIIGLFYLIPHLEERQSHTNAYEESQRLKTYITMFRTYYNHDILSKIKKHSDLKVNFDHKTNDNTVPLPATVLHDMAENFTNGTDVSVQMYSNFPFPNRENRILDKFQKESLAYLLKNPDKQFSREEIIDGKSVYRTSFPDFLSETSCVSCHNSRADTPKNDWKLGDIRGVIEVSVPLHHSLNSSQNLTYNILIFILLNFSVLIIYYFILMKKRNKTLEEKFVNKDKILSEYKKAVDLGAIVSKTDKNGIITYANDAFINISGYSRDELIGKSHNLVRHSDTSKEIFTELWKTILNKNVWQGDIKNRKKDGSSYFVHASVVPILDEKNEIVEFLAIRYDSTSLHKAIKKAHIAEKAKGDFLANMSHELRTPLNAIIGFSQILQRRKTLDEKDKNYVSKIHISGENLLRLVNSILDFSKIEEGKMDCVLVNTDISELFDETIVLIESQAKKKKIQITLNGLDTKQNIVVDKQLLKQVFINILSNSVKFTPQNGHVNINYEFKDSKHHFSICDDGIGIAKDDITNIFSPFKQGSNAKQTQVKGTGLGLAISHKIITELHNGKISVQSEINKGTCFFITL